MISMFLLTTETTDPFYNLAVEEVLMRNSSDEFIILGINSRSVIVGKHQCPHREINTEFVTGNNIPVIRRITGGGTVFHDEGNFTFAFIHNTEQGRQVDFPRYTKPVIGFLHSIGVPAELSGTDIRVNGSKISGNAEHVWRRRVLHHGTILYNTDLGFLKESIRSDTSCYKTSAVISNPSHVVNLSNLITQFRDIFDFRSAVSGYLKNAFQAISDYELPCDAKDEALKIADSKYRSWEWTFGYGPEYEMHKNFRFMENDISCKITVKGGIISDCELSGTGIPEDEGKKLEGCRHMPADLSVVLENTVLAGINVYIFS
jgi:lipoate---protein ligase